MGDNTGPDADHDLLAAFEGCTLSRDQWTHRAHVRVAFLYARQHGLDGAITSMRIGIQALNAVHGMPESLDRGYHETITVAFLRLIDAACRNEPCASSEEFCDRHPHLLTKLALQKYYSRERLRSCESKERFVPPDLAPLPDPSLIAGTVPGEHAVAQSEEPK